MSLQAVQVLHILARVLVPVKHLGIDTSMTEPNSVFPYKGISKRKYFIFTLKVSSIFIIYIMAFNNFPRQFI